MFKYLYTFLLQFKFPVTHICECLAIAMSVCVCMASDVSAVVHLKSFGAVCLAKGTHFGV